jgi:hypothetical protein
VRRRVLTVASLVAACFVASPGGQAPETGIISGHVKLTTRIEGRALPSTAYPTRAVGDHDPTAIPEIKNVVVYLKDVAFHGVLPTTNAELRQEHETFLPHVLATSDEGPGRIMGRKSSRATFGCGGSSICVAWCDPGRELVTASAADAPPPTPPVPPSSPAENELLLG